MIQVYAHTLLLLLEKLKELETEAPKWNWLSARQENIERSQRLLSEAHLCCDALNFASARKQVKTILTRTQPPGGVPADEFANLLAELHTRIYEDMEEAVFYCVTDPIKIRQFYERQRNAPQGQIPQLQFKHADQLFDARILRRWDDLTEDIEEACQCFVFDRFTACAFHLMRVVEFGVRKVAKLGGIKDAKASWGAVLDKLHKYAFATEYKDLPPDVQPFIGIIRNLLPHMQAIQRAWRNDKVAHISEKLVPVKTIKEEDAHDMMVAVNGFMRTLAQELPLSE
jgi:hypothetical protein